MSIPAQGAVGAETMTAGPRMVLLPMDEPRRPLNDSGLPSVMIWAGGEAYDELTMPGVAAKALDLDSCALAVGIYRAMTEAHAKEIATLTPPAALASPRADSDERKAGENITVEGAPGNRLAPWLLSGSDEEVIEALMRRSAGDVACLFFPTPVNVADPIRRTYYEGRPPRQQRLLAELLCRLKPATPAQPAGAVPDSLREVFEAAKGMLRLSEMGFEESLKEPEESGNFAAYTRVKAAIAAAEPLLASHPAGQSAGSGVEIDQKSAWARAAETVGTEKPWWWDKPWAELSYGSQGDVQAWFQNRDPLHRVVEPDGPDRYVRRYCDPRPHMLAPAPDSTRTGDEGAEWVLVPTRMDVGMIAAFWRWKNTGSDTPGEFGDDRSDAAAYRAMIAARPAAPEAQGAWRPIAEAKHDGTVYLLGFYDGPEKTDEHWCAVEGWYETGINDRCWYDVFNERVEPAYFRERPAPPASSGQEG